MVINIQACPFPSPKTVSAYEHKNSWMAITGLNLPCIHLIFGINYVTYLCSWKNMRNLIWNKYQLCDPSWLHTSFINLHELFNDDLTEKWPEFNMSWEWLWLGRSETKMRTYYLGKGFDFIWHKILIWKVSCLYQQFVSSETYT